MRPIHPPECRGFVGASEALRPFVRHAELFGPECVFETATAMWWKTLPSPVDLTWMGSPQRERILEEREQVFAQYRADVLRLRVEVDLITNRGASWKQNGHRPKRAKDIKQAVVTLAAEGLPPVEIARDLGLRIGPPPKKGELDSRALDPERVVRMLESHRADTRRRRRSGQETREAAAALRAEGLITTEIAGKLGISPERVQRLLREQELQAADRGGFTPSNAGVLSARVANPMYGGQ